MSEDQRRLPRYLCPEEFSDTIIKAEGKQYQFVSLNYNSLGVAVYSHQKLPEFRNCTLTFSLALEDKTFDVHEIPSFVHYRIETENGHQYGIEFQLIAISDFTLRRNLIEIERQLKLRDNPENRWNL